LYYIHYESHFHVLIENWVSRNRVRPSLIKRHRPTASDCKEKYLEYLVRKKLQKCKGWGVWELFFPSRISGWLVQEDIQREVLEPFVLINVKCGYPMHGVKLCKNELTCQSSNFEKIKSQTLSFMLSTQQFASSIHTTYIYSFF